MSFLKNYGVVLLVPGVIVGLAVMGTLWDIQGQSAMLGHPAPPFELPVEAGPGAAEGDQLRLADLRGKHVILDFWASYCPPCRRSVPVLNQLQRTHGSGLQVIAVNVQADPIDSVRQQHANLGWEVPTVTDRAFRLQENYDVRALPTLVLIDPDGVVRYSHQGVPELGHLTELILGGSPAAVAGSPVH